MASTSLAVQATSNKVRFDQIFNLRPSQYDNKIFSLKIREIVENYSVLIVIGFVTNENGHIQGEVTLLYKLKDVYSLDKGIVLPPSLKRIMSEIKHGKYLSGVEELYRGWSFLPKEVPTYTFVTDVGLPNVSGRRREIQSPLGLTARFLSFNILQHAASTQERKSMESSSSTTSSSLVGSSAPALLGMSVFPLMAGGQLEGLVNDPLMAPIVPGTLPMFPDGLSIMPNASLSGFNSMAGMGQLSTHTHDSEETTRRQAGLVPDLFNLGIQDFVEQDLAFPSVPLSMWPVLSGGLTSDNGHLLDLTRSSAQATFGAIHTQGRRVMDHLSTPKTVLPFSIEAILSTAWPTLPEGLRGGMSMDMTNERGPVEAIVTTSTPMPRLSPMLPEASPRRWQEENQQRYAPYPSPPTLYRQRNEVDT